MRSPFRPSRKTDSRSSLSPVEEGSLVLRRHARHRTLHWKALCDPPFCSPEFDFSPKGSMLPGSPQSFFPTEPISRNGLSLARNGCSLSEASIPGSMVPACHFKTSRLDSPPGLPSAPLPSLVCPSRGQLHRVSPLRFLAPVRPAASSISTPLRENCLPRDRSVRQIPPPCGSPSPFARFPFAPRRRSIARLAADHRSRTATFPEAAVPRGPVARWSA